MKHLNELTAMIDHLNKARFQIERAYAKASKLAACCECSMEELLNEIDRQIETTRMHISEGFETGDLYKRGAK